MAEEMGLFEVMYNCRAMRRLDTREVEEEKLRQLIEAANQAPSGSNMQSARWIIARDSEVKQKLADLNRKGVEVYLGNQIQNPGSLPHQDKDKRGRMVDAVVWQMTTGIAAQKPKVALEALHRLLDAGDPPHKLLGLVAWQLRGVVSSLEALRRGAGDTQAARAGGLKPDVFRVVKAQAQYWRQGDLARTIEKIAATNMAMNSRRIGDRRAFESLVLELCQA